MRNFIQDIKVLDHGYVKYIEHYGSGEAGIHEAGIIEAARQSTQGSFEGWGCWNCDLCKMNVEEAGKHNVASEGENVRFCDNTEFFTWNAQDAKLLKYLHNNNHTTPFEFAGAVFEIQAPIIVFREHHRHRTQSYNEMSARYSPLPDINYMPTLERLFLTNEKNKQAQAAVGAEVLTEIAADQWLAELDSFYEAAEKFYQFGLKIGIPKELARLCIPVGRYSRMRASANLLNWLKFVALRSAPNAQWEIQQFSNAIADILTQLFPQVMELFYAKQNPKV